MNILSFSKSISCMKAHIFCFFFCEKKKNCEKRTLFKSHKPSVVKTCEYFIVHILEAIQARIHKNQRQEQNNPFKNEKKSRTNHRDHLQGEIKCWNFLVRIIDNAREFFFVIPKNQVDCCLQKIQLKKFN